MRLALLLAALTACGPSDLEAWSHGCDVGYENGAFAGYLVQVVCDNDARASDFVFDRDPNPHLAFGLGIHSCLGASLARLEGRIAVASLLRHLDGISLCDPNDARLDGFGAPAFVMVELRRAG